MPRLNLPHNHGEENSEHIREFLSKDDRFTLASELLRQVSDPVKIKIFWLLSHREECLINISAYLGMTSSALLHHLRPMKEAGIINARKEGREVYYKAIDTEESRLLHKTIEAFMQIVCPDNTHHTHTSSSHLASEVAEYIEYNLQRRVTIEELSHKFLINSTTLKKLFKESFCVTIGEYARKIRLKKAVELISCGVAIGEAAHSLGYLSVSRFSSAFEREYGVLPSKYRKTAEES